MDETNTLYDRPQTPDESNCCGNACNPCIFDIHKQLLEKWKRKKNVNITEKKNLLVPMSYRLFHVEKVEKINKDYIILHLKYSEQYDSADESILIDAGQYVIMNILSWSKPFTPIAWTDESLTLLIRIYSNGVNTNRLSNIDLDTELRIRGPYGDFKYIRNSFMNIIMFGIGSGLAALYQIAKSIIDDEKDETRIYLNIGFQSVDQVPLMKELKLLADFWNFMCTLYITQQDELHHINGIAIKYERINETIFESAVEKYSPENTLILICGNEKFNESLESWSKKYYYGNYHVFK